MIRAGRPDAALAPLVLNADGSSQSALAPVELGNPDVLGQVDSAVRGCGRILVGVARGPLLASAALRLAVLDCTLLEGTAPPGAGPRTYVPVADAGTATERLSQSVRSGPLAALTLAGLLRVTDRPPVAEGLAAESAAYSTLLTGPEFAASAGAAVGRCRDRVRARLHGACAGAGIEAPAFAARVTAHLDDFFQLPELAMGLNTGAGRTVGVTRRVGRRRAAWPALTGHRLGAVAARDWRLVDHLADHR
ncbi:hypothetical protein [Streptomyces sp. NPDC059262]|uniref:hypothetical protein n=1 Tax=Streptomyces sp. NPDC059262 TaxID=3346797 RepID=UPI0036A95C94